MDFEEIYSSRTEEYDALVRREDASGRLWAALDRLVDWAGADVCELGAGTGRLTTELAARSPTVVAFDRSPSMLGVARRRLDGRSHADVALGVAEHRAVPLADHSVDVVVEGWAFGHYIDFEPDRWTAAIDAALAECRRVVRGEAAPIVLIETLGTGTTEAMPPTADHAALYARLEDVHGFERHEVRTDYEFTDRMEAERLVAGFFGEGMLTHLTGPQGASLPEVTGIWIARRTRGSP